ncbi:MAG: PAS domain-containing sensor histidine kinase [Rhodospirillales bacterium]|nr:PAS domain-containing sensor histidine kinase [Rhodospirillales bacterium]
MRRIVRTPRRLVARLRRWTRATSFARRLAYVLSAAAVASGLATLATMTAPETNPRVILSLLYLDILFVLPLGAVVSWRLARLWGEHRRGLAGSRLQARLVVLFGLVAVTPAILVAVFAGLFLNFGLESWFSGRVRTALNAAEVVAEAYLKEHKQSIVSEIAAMANDLDGNAAALIRNPQHFENVLTTQAALRSLPEAAVLDSTGRVTVQSRFTVSLTFDPVPQTALEKAGSGEIVVMTGEKDDRVRAMVRLHRFVDAFLLVGRPVDPVVIEQTQQARGAISQYELLEQHQESIQISFVMIFVVVALLLLLAAVWVGVNLAAQLSHPISNLIAAAQRIGKGDLKARVKADSTSDEIGTLSRAFNRMTEQLETQQLGLMEANRELDERRRFSEAVLTGVSAGVIGLDRAQRITLPNRSASQLLVTDLEGSIGIGITEIFPEIDPMMREARYRPDRLHQSEIRVTRDRSVRTLLVRVAAERQDDEIVGYVVTFDDITALQSAQRKAAWADIARRIAHEIKNPLTPIQLSAERLKRKYLEQITSDRDTFSMCTDTIIRQVEDIGRMVDDFSSFARMPQPSMKPENLVEICRQAVFLERTRHPEIAFDLREPEQPISLRCDNRQVGRALANVLKNAAESIERRETDANLPGEIVITLRRTEDTDDSRVVIVVEDNGIGLPEEHRDRLTEPYVTTRDKGTGLGLAIVKKIMEDHDGDLLLEDRPVAGARISLIFGSQGAASAVSDEGGGAANDTDASGSLNAATDIPAHGS